MNSADLQGFVRNELEALSAGIDNFSSDLSSVLTHEESSKLENAAMELSPVPEALVTVRAAREKMKGKSEGKGEPAISFSGGCHATPARMKRMCSHLLTFFFGRGGEAVSSRWVSPMLLGGATCS